MISIVVLAKNEQNLLTACLESVGWADEIIVIDDNSTDKTVEIAKKYTKNVFTHKRSSFSESRNFGLSKTKGEWILYIDADERVTANLKDEILSIVKGQMSYAAFAISRKNILLGKWQKHQGWWPDYQIRLFKKDNFKGWVGDLHEQPNYEGKLKHLKNPLIHLTHRDVLSMMQKTIEWAPIEAKLRFDVGHPKMSWWRFLRIIKVEALKRFFGGAAKDGIEGWIELYYQTFSLFISYVKLWELQRGESLEETYEKIDKNLLESGFKDEVK
ncbi:MAG TPA: glycosyltransferase family 2 protein [Patescibacteria group bacterium]